MRQLACWIRPPGEYGRKTKQKRRSGLKWKCSFLKKAQGGMPCPSSLWRQDIQVFSSPWKVVSRDISISPNLYHPCPALLAIISDFKNVLLPWPHLATLLLPVSDEQLETCLCIRAVKWRVFSMQKASLLFSFFLFYSCFFLFFLIREHCNSE